VKKLFLAAALQITTALVFGQGSYWQQEANFSIDVSLNDKTHSLDAFERIEYINNSPDTLLFIWFHVWPNAYKNDKTAFSDQLLENGITRFYFSGKDEKGYINRLNFKVNDITALVEDHPEHIDIIKLVLPSPLLPGKRINISTPFHVKLPFNISRGGHDGQSYQATQWYPKPAVYDRNGWHPMPYLDQGEFYSEFGNFDVSITVPANYVVAATGELQDEQEKVWLQSRSSYLWEPTKEKIKIKGGGFKTIVKAYPPSDTKVKTLHFKQDRVHDFAWFADKRFAVQQDTCRLASGKLISVFNYYYDSGTKPLLVRGTDLIKSAARFYSQQLGEYPYNVLSVVQGPESFGGGMEYPTIAIVAPLKNLEVLENTIVHEIGHNWLYGILATNERDYPWLDEGINTFYEDKYNNGSAQVPGTFPKLLFRKLALEKTDQAISTHSQRFSAMNYELVAYDKTAEWMRLLESAIGKDTFQMAMQEYYRRWQFKHPQPRNLQETVEQISQRKLDSLFMLLDQKGLLRSQQLSSTRIGFAASRNITHNFTLHPVKHLFYFGPVLGANAYDKLMAGIFLSNIKLPPSRLQFFLAPMYAIGSKTFTGIGFARYSAYSSGLLKQIDIGLSAAKFSSNEFERTDGKKFYFGFQKYVPSIRLTLNSGDARKTTNSFIQWKTYFFREQEYRIRFDTTINLPDTTISQVVNTQHSSRTLNQLKIVTENYRALYPYRAELKIEQGEDFVRAAFTGNYHFNYSKNGGLNVRLFAGKFLYTSAKTFTKQFETDRYHLNLTGANGYEDYTYSDYFIGRNKFEGYSSQQIMVRDGAFKIRTDLLGDKIGKTDDWMLAINFNSDLPSTINLAKLLPGDFSLKIFADIGTVAEAWKRNSNEDRFLFDAGLQLSFLKETIHIYAPLIYSRIFKDYVQSYLPKKNRFWRTFSFSIDISNFNLRKLDRRLWF
jgi:hypothetical protein